jgi:ParB-like chromosome segregation protein Spo0J
MAKAKQRPSRARAGSDQSAQLRVQPEHPPAEWVDPSELVPWADNPRQNDGEPVARVMRSIKRFGFGAPIVARKANKEIIAGHTRWKAAREMGLRYVPVRFLELSEPEAHVLALKDNRDTELTPWDESLLDVLDGMPRADIEFAGWDDAALAKLEQQFKDDEPEPAEDQSGLIGHGFAVIIECSDEAEQVTVLQQCEGLGWRCRALT